MIERLRVRIPAGAAGECSSPESTLCADSYSVSPPVLPQWHVKDPGHSAKSAGGRLYLNMRVCVFVLGLLLFCLFCFVVVVVCVCVCVYVCCV